MRLKPFPLLGVLLVFAAAVTSNLYAGSKHHSTAKQTPKPPTHSLIVSITATSIRVQEGKESKSFAINSDTEIDYNGQRVTASDLKPGMRVEVTQGMDEGVAERINATEAPPPPKKK